MATGARIQVFEHQKLYIKTNPNGFGLTTDQWESLVRYADEAPLPYYRPIHRGIQFSHFVGVIQVGKLTIEILPKIGQYSPNTTFWHQVLLDMLRESRLLDIRSVSKANLSLQPRSILDLYLGLFLAELDQLLQQGLLKSYRQTNENRTALRGKLLFPQQLVQNFLHQERFFVCHQVYDTETIQNRLLFKALKLVLLLTNQPQLITKARTLLLDFPAQTDLAVTEETFTQLPLNRKTERYRPALAIARMLLLHYHPDLIQGANHILALLFDMNKVWEGFIFHRIRKAMATELFEIHAEPSQPFWGRKKIHPDIYLKRKIQTPNLWSNLILDAKWKANPTLSPADDDLKQMYVYNHHFQSARSILVYPSLQDTTVTLSRPFYLPGSAGTHSCQLCALKVVDEQGLNKNLAAELLAIVNQT